VQVTQIVIHLLLNLTDRIIDPKQFFAEVSRIFTEALRCVRRVFRRKPVSTPTQLRLNGLGLAQQPLDPQTDLFL